MIKLEVEDYCHQCVDFVPDVKSPDRLMAGDKEIVFQTDTLIRCEYRRRCASIKRYLEQQAKGAVSSNE